MSLGTILVTLDGTTLNDNRCELARALALKHQAHLVALANIRPIDLPQGLSSAFSQDVARTFHDTRDEVARQWCDAFEERTRDYGLRSFETRVGRGEPADVLRTQAHYTDLIIVSQPEEKPQPSSYPEDALIDLVMSGGRPVLFVPHSGLYVKPFERALIAWSAAPESQRAISDALPLLRACRHVDVIVINPSDGRGRHGEVPGADLSLYLARNGLNVELHIVPSEIRIGEEILSRASDYGSDLLVMGCFGHSRMRELLTGGTSLTLLRTMTLPVLFSH
ncbi:MAG: universal stress protein [Burkholderiaceae bacterium]